MEYSWTKGQYHEVSMVLAGRCRWNEYNHWLIRCSQFLGIYGDLKALAWKVSNLCLMDLSLLIHDPSHWMSLVHPCVDYWELNKVTGDVAYPIPRTHDCLDTMSGPTMVSTMDITLAYNQVPITEQDIPKAAFVAKYGLYEFTKMPLGLSTALQTYQCLMLLTLSGLQWSSCLIYLDNFIVFSHDF